MTGEKNKLISDFCAVNSSYWPKLESIDKNKIILAEGFFAESGPNYVIRVGAIARTMQEILKCDAAVILQIGKKKEADKIKIWQSFGFENFIGMSGDIYREFSFVKKSKIIVLINFYYFLSKLIFFLRGHKFFLNLKFKNIVIGDFLYDEMVRENELIHEPSERTYIIKKVTPQHKKFFKRVLIGFYAVEEIYKKFKPQYYVTTRTQYTAYGLAARCFIYWGTKVIETTDDILFFYDDKKLYPPKFHSTVKNMIESLLQNLDSNEKRIEVANRELNVRFAGKMEQIDAKMAYQNKHQYSDSELRKKLGINNDNPIVFIFAHIFVDATRGLSEETLFIDYYKWLRDTLQFVNEVKEINWVVKPHPSARAYGEVGEVEKLVQQVCRPDSSIYNCPSDFNTVSVLNCAKAIVTAQGTVGLEYSCMGIPVVLAGKPFYYGFGFTHEPATKKEYFVALKNIKNIEPLSEEKIQIAKCVYAAFFEIQSKDFSLVDNAIRDKVWGASDRRDVPGAFEIMTERLKKINPRNSGFCKQIEEYFA